MFAIPRNTPEGLSKEDLLGALIIVRLDDYDPETATKYGVSHTVTAQVTVVDGPLAGTVEPEFFCAGNLAKQIGQGLDVGTMAPGRIIKGSGSQGREWYGIEWATTAADLQAAEAALTPAPAKPVPLGTQTRQAASNIRQRVHTQAGDTEAPF